MSGKREYTFLGIIIAAAVLARVLFIWVGRPEFVGWFNHTYYYYVEVRGLLEEGQLPYPDMPLLFYLYALVAKVFILAGTETDAAIVQATRLCMSIIPALIPIPVYLLLKRIAGHRALPRRWWILVAAAGFLPLTMAHMPEFLQKNALGLLFFAFVLLQTHRLLADFQVRTAVVTAVLVLLIILTHFGTVGVVALWGLAMLLTFLIQQRDRQRSLRLTAMLVGGSLIVLLLLRLIDPKRLDRVFHYFGASIGNSWIGSLFGDAPAADKWIAVAGIVLPLAFALLLYDLYRKRRAPLSPANTSFWLACIIFTYLLVFPLGDQRVVARFTLFLSLPLIPILAFHDAYRLRKRWLKITCVAAAGLGVAVLAFGEYMSLQFHSRYKDDAYEELMTLDEQIDFQRNDLILTKNGAEHICNWFLRTKAGVITALNKTDFDQYDNIYVLNPIEGALNFEDIQNRTADNEEDRYLFMLRNIPRPGNAAELIEMEHLQFFRLPEPPPEWDFDKRGNWVSYMR